MVKKKASGKIDSELLRLAKLGKKIQNERKKRGWTLEDTEEKGYRSWQHWQAIESGKKNINFSTLCRISKVLKMTPSDLLKNI